MRNFDLEAWSFVGTLIAAAAAAIALAFNAYEMRQASKGRDLEWLFRFQDELRKLEAGLRTASEKDRNAALVELMNYLNLAAGACRKRLLPRHARGHAHDYLCQAFALIEVEGLGSIFDDLKTSEETFDELRKFQKANQQTIKKREAELRSIDEAKVVNQQQEINAPVASPPPPSATR